MSNITKKKTSVMKAFSISTKNSRMLLLATVVFVLLSVVISYLTPQIVRITIDVLIGGEEPSAVDRVMLDFLGGEEFLRNNIIVVGAAIAILAVVMGIITFLKRFCQQQTSNRVSKKLKNDMFNHIQSLPFSYHTSVQTGDIIQRATQDTDLIARFIANQFFELFYLVFLLGIGITIMLLMSVPLSITALIFIPIMGITSAIVFPRIASNFLKADEAEGSMTAKLQENLTGIRVVRAFGAQAREVKEFSQKNNEYVNIWIRLGKMLSVFWSTGDLLGGVQMLSILVVGAFLTVSGAITAGTLLAFLLYSQMIIWPVRNVGRILAETGKAKAAYHRLFEVLDAQKEDYNEDGLTLDIKGEIEFKNVSFGFLEDSSVLKNISFKLPAGSSLGILGATGSGKSTLGHLINRLYDPNAGSITIDGIDIREYKLSHLRKNVGLVLQEPYLFSKTVRDNINLVYSHEMDEIKEYTRIANVDDAIEGLDKGYDTIVGEKGVVLSGGQKQRIAISRTLINKPPIIIFDDSLSSVDTETDFKIRTALKERLKDITTIFISHRLSTLMTADKIIVLEGGEIAEIGSHDELIGREGSYKRIFELQNNVE